MGRRGILVLVVALAAGCSRAGPPPPTTVPARGRVLLPDGQPLPGGRVELKPTANPAVEAFGDVDPGGSFTLTTYAPGDGSIPGTYKVVISPFNYRSRSGSPTKIAAAGRVPARYREAGTSDLTVEVRPAG